MGLHGESAANAGRQAGAGACDPAPRSVPGSTVSLTVAQTRDAYNPPDWFPDAHPPMPPVGGAWPAEGDARVRLLSSRQRPGPARERVARRAAGGVHRSADGRLQERRSQERRAEDGAAQRDDPGREGGHRRRRSRTAAAYFSSFPFKKWIRVVESKDVPKTRIAGSMHVPTNDGTEPLGRRIIEMPEDLERTEIARCVVADLSPTCRSAASREASRWCKTGGTARRVACGTCHGADLKGLGPVPPLAGRSPSYTVRQLFDHAARRAKGTVVGADESGGGEAHHRRHDRDRRLTQLHANRMQFHAKRAM